MKVLFPQKIFYIALLFMVLVGVVFSVHASHRTEHFQECDSTQVYDALHNFPAPSLSFNSYISGGTIISEEQAKKMLSWPPALSLMSFYRERYHVTDEEEFTARIMRALTRLNPITLFRAGYIAIVSQFSLPYSLQSFFALPTASTYSPGAGFLYGLLSTVHTSYDDFMSRSILLSLGLFMLSVLVFYGACRKAGVSTIVSVIAATLLLFSVSMYSYAYHLGSTIFNVATTFIWMFFFIKYRNENDFLKKMSRVTAISIFFNYLISLFWLALACAHIFEVSRNGDRKFSMKIFASNVWVFLKTQKLAITAFTLIALLFYPMGQSYRGGLELELASLPLRFYNVTLNFFGFYSKNLYVHIFQIIVVSVLLLVAVVDIVRKDVNASPLRVAFYHLIAALGVIYGAMVCMRVLAFYPSRHLLFFAPPLFLLIAFALERIINRFRVPHTVLVCCWIVIVFFGFTSLFARITDTKDRLVIGTVDTDVKKIYIDDCSVSLGYKDWGVKVPVEVIKPTTFNPEKDTVYQYMSQFRPVQETFEAIERGRLIEKKLIIEVLSESYATSNTCFIGFFSAPSCNFGTPNQIYSAKFLIH